MSRNRLVIVLTLVVGALYLFPNQLIQAQEPPLFRPAPNSPFRVDGILPNSLEAADFNRDGHLDIVTANAAISSGISMLFGSGTGNFTLFTSTFGSPQINRGIAAADFNGDGLTDVATLAGEPLSRRLFVLLGDGEGNFLTANAADLTGHSPLSLAAADLNADGLPDLALADDNVPGAVLIFLNQGRASFAQAAGSPIDPVAPSGVWSLAVGDVNLDSHLDIVTANNTADTVSVLLGDGTGSFVLAPGSPIPIGTGAAFAVSIADFDQDGLPDIAVADNHQAATGVNVLSGDGAGGFSLVSGSPFNTAHGPAFSLTTGDFNLDSRPDIATANTLGNSASVLLNTGNGFSAAPGSPFNTGATQPRMVISADFDENGLLDLALVHYESYDVAIMLNQSILPTPTPTATSTTTQVPSVTVSPTATLQTAQPTRTATAVTPTPGAAPFATPTFVPVMQLPATGEPPWYFVRLRAFLLIVTVTALFTGLLVAFRWLRSRL
jgi:cell division septation protein DedD